MAPVNGKLTCYTRENVIVTAYGDGFWEIKVRRIQSLLVDLDQNKKKIGELVDLVYVLNYHSVQSIKGTVVEDENKAHTYLVRA